MESLPTRERFIQENKQIDTHILKQTKKRTILEGWEGYEQSVWGECKAHTYYKVYSRDTK
jgi:hypothetical protein